MSDINIKTQKTVKHQHGTPNPIISKEEISMLATVDKNLASSSSAPTIGQSGEILLRDFLNKHLPFTMRAATGHFVPPSGILSPQIDIMILDARYPLLAENTDGSILAMLHSVIATIEVKTRVKAIEIKGIVENSSKIMSLASEVDGYSGGYWGCISTFAFIYRSKNRLNTLIKYYSEFADPTQSLLDIYLLRLPDNDLPKDNKHIGMQFHLEPIPSETNPDVIIEHEIFITPHHTILSDFYYRIVQNSYYTLDTRGYSYGDIGAHVMDYMAWSTYRPIEPQ